MFMHQFMFVHRNHFWNHNGQRMRGGWWPSSVYAGPFIWYMILPCCSNIFWKWGGNDLHPGHSLRILDQLCLLSKTWHHWSGGDQSYVWNLIKLGCIWKLFTQCEITCRCACATWMDIIQIYLKWGQSYDRCACVTWMDATGMLLRLEPLLISPSPQSE